MSDKKDVFTHKDGWDALNSIHFRYNGKSYTKNQTYSYCHTKYVKEMGLSLLKSEIDIERKNLMIEVIEGKTLKKEWLKIPFSDFVKANNNREPIYLSYKDREYTKTDLNIFSYIFVNRNCNGLFTSYWVSHKTDELVIKYNDGSFFKKSVRIPLDMIENVLVQAINYKKY